MKIFTFICLSLAALMFSCGSPDQPTFRPYREMFATQPDSTLAKLTSWWNTKHKPQPEIDSSYTQGWSFTPGDSTEGLTPQQITKGHTPVLLPHRLLRPNTPLWYSALIQLKQPGILRIRADDGAQLFINGKSIKRLHDEYFPLMDTGSLEITVRVLNNAMSGGLRSVGYISNKGYDNYRTKLDLFNRLSHLVEKTVLLNNKSDGLVKEVVQVLDLPTEQTISNIEANLSAYPFLIGPWITKVDSNHYRISLMTDINQEVSLRFGSKRDELKQTLTQTGDVIHFDLPVATGTPVFYQLQSQETMTPVYSFDTSEKTSFTFNAWADSQSGWATFQKNLDRLGYTTDAFGIGAGDLVGDGSDAEEWRSFYNVLSLHSPYVPFNLVAGNHDYDGFYDDLEPVFYHRLNRPGQTSYFSWTYSNCAFIMLDPNESFPIDIANGSEQHQWFEKEIISPKWKSATWKFIVLHQPPYSQGWEGYSGDHFLRKLIEPLAQSGAVDFVVTGHTHDYERLTIMNDDHPTTYLIMGGGGGSLEPPESSLTPEMDTVVKAHHIGRFHVNDKTIKLTVIGSDGVTIDTLTRKK